MTTVARMLLVDGDAHTSALLASGISRRRLGEVQVVTELSSLPPLIAAGEVDVVIVNHRFEQDAALAACNMVKRMAPECATLVAASPGPALKVVREFGRQSGNVDAIVEKPFVGESFYLLLQELLGVKATERQLRGQADRLSRLVPAGALSSLAAAGEPQAELFDAAVLFTDIRDSSRLITQMPPREFFGLLNEVLSAQTRCIQDAQGSIVKYTGDGLMAVFRGMGRSYLALRCGLELAAMSRTQSLPFGVGLAQGLVLAGLIGDAGGTGRRRQFDVIGATAHLAARLCSRAEPGQLVVTRSINAVAQVRQPAPVPIDQVSIRGFDQPVDCVAFNPEPV
jgi:class 3 adenylate cyclase